MYEQAYNTSRISDLRFMDFITIGFRRGYFQNPLNYFILITVFFLFIQQAKEK